ncbi:MAG: hypothetical protein ACOCXD_02410, partial [Bacteroidota bacterium]
MQIFKGTIISIVLFFLLALAPARDDKEIFLEAESYFHFEEYNEALPSYLRLLKLYPDNANLNYKIGICYLNIPYEKEKSITYLEKAKSSLTEKYKENSFKETNAPPDVFFYLGNAYRINNELDEALENYYHFKEILNPSVYKEELVDEQITAVLNARKLKANPVDVDITNLGEKINSRFAQKNPVISPDGSKLIYVEELQFYDAVFFAEKKNGEWQYPRNLIPEFGIDGDVYPTSISSDGTELYLYRNEGFLGEIYVSHYKNGVWSKPNKLGENINTKYWESHASISSDGKTLYFTSNRKGGYGGLDIYKSFRNSDGTWGPAVNLGPVINTPYNEETPFITEDGKTLYFSSYGHFNMGGYDVFYSSLYDDGTWSPPLNVGYPINTTDDNVFYQPFKNGKFAYMSRFEDDNTLGRNDIYLLTIYSETHPRKFQISGIVRLDGKVMHAPSSVEVTIIDQENKRTILEKLSASVTDSFTVKLPAGKYTMQINEEGFEEFSRDFEITKDFQAGDVTLETILKKPEEISPDMDELPVDPKLSIKNKEIYTDAGETLKLKLKTENADHLEINVLVDSVYRRKDNFPVKRNRFTYKYTPGEGLNMLEIILHNNEGGESRDTIWIQASPEKTPEDQIPESMAGKSDDTDQVTEDIVENLYFDTMQFNAIRDLLYQHAPGHMKEYIAALNPDSFPGTRSLASGIIKDTSGIYSMDDLENLFSGYAEASETMGFARALARFARPGLKNVLDTLMPDKAGIASPAELTDYLYKLSGEKIFTSTQVLKALAAMAHESDMKEFIEGLKIHSAPDLNKIITRYVEPAELKSPNELVDYLLENHPTYESELKDGLTNLARETYLHYLLDKMIKMSEGNLRELLQYLKSNLENENITDL